MRAQRDFAERVETMVNATKLTHMQQDELNDKLIDAVKNGDIKNVRELIENGADVNAKDKNNETAVEIAIRRGYHQIAELIDDSIKHHKALDILDVDMNELVRMADESAKSLCRKG